MTLIVPLDSGREKLLLNFLSRDPICNLFALLDLKVSRDRTKIWLALEDEEIIGYLLEHDNRILSLRGAEKCAAGLLQMSALTGPELNVEPANIPAANSVFEPVEPVGTSRGRINAITAMKVSKKRFKPFDKCGAKKLGADEFGPLGDLFERFYAEMALGPISREQVGAILNRCTQHGATYGIHENGGLVSFASGTHALEGLAHLSPVYTLPESRRKGYATTACSALTEDLLGSDEMVMLFVSERNVPALKVYAKIGFRRTGHAFITYRGRKLPPQP